MSGAALPSYLRMAKPNLAKNRLPWHRSAAPIYAGLFFSYMFYSSIGVSALPGTDLVLSLLGLGVASLICYFCFYIVPTTLGMTTGYPLLVVGSSTYGTRGCLLVPGLLMGLLWLWVLAKTAFTCGMFSSMAMGSGGPLMRSIVAIIVICVALIVASKGIRWVAILSILLPIAPLLLILTAFFANVGSVGNHIGENMPCFLGTIGVAVGYFVAAGAASTNLGMYMRDRRDVRRGGFLGIVAAAMVAGGLSVAAVAGWRGANPDVSQWPTLDEVRLDAFGAVVRYSVPSELRFSVYAVSSLLFASFCAFIAVSTFRAMLPKAKTRTVVVLLGAASILLEISGLALSLIWVSWVVQAAFGALCGSMAADYILSGRRWAGPRRAVNWAGCIAWLVAIVVAILLRIQVPTFAGLAPVITFVTGFALYTILAKAGLEPAAVEMPAPPAEMAVQGATEELVAARAETLTETEDEPNRAVPQVPSAGKKADADRLQKARQARPDRPRRDEKARVDKERRRKAEQMSARRPEGDEKLKADEDHRQKVEQVPARGPEPEEKVRIPEAPQEKTEQERAQGLECGKDARPEADERREREEGPVRGPEPAEKARVDEARRAKPEEAPARSAERDEVFISYSHKDRRWLEKLQVHLKVMVRNRGLSVWADARIKPGAHWKDDIKTAIARAKVAVLLVSPNFLASDFVAHNELPPLLDAAEKEGLVIIWIPVSSSLYYETDIGKYQAAHDPNRPLDKLSKPDQNRVFVEICKRIAEGIKS